MKNAVEFINVSMIRNGIRILDSLSISIGIEESVAIIGPNGSGKTSLMKIIKGDARPYRDENSDTICRLFGEDRWNIFDLRNKMGVVSMDLQSRFNDTASVGEVIMSGFFRTTDIHKDHVITDAMVTDVENAASRVGIEDKLTKDFGKLSLGEKRRVLIARALVPRPKMLLLDEPMASLDISVKTDLRRMLDLLMENGTGIVMITHDLEDIPTEIQRVIMMKSGRIFDDGPKDKILTSERMSSLFSSKIKVTEENGTYHMTSS